MNEWMLNGTSAQQAIQCLQLYESLTSVKVYISMVKNGNVQVLVEWKQDVVDKNESNK